MPENSIAASFHALIDWVSARWSERASWNGLTVIVLCLLFVMLSPVLVFGAWLGVAYGIWILVTRRQHRPV
jgi:hypothetical protein